MTQTIKIEHYNIDPRNGFIAGSDPLKSLPKQFLPWEQIASELPKLLVAGQVRKFVKQLPQLDPSPLSSNAELERAMMLLSFIGNSYVWGAESGNVASSLPVSLALPWYQVAQKLGRPPVLSYVSYVLYNWKRIENSGPIALGNIALLQNFVGGLDEEWFVLVHVDIEIKAAGALSRFEAVQNAVLQNDVTSLIAALKGISSSLEAVYAGLSRMPEKCDPYIYYNRVRPYIHGWKNHPEIPNGLVYEGVDAYAGKPQSFRGQTGAQSSIIPSMDALLGIGHREDMLAVYLKEMRQYMPVKHSEFISALEKGPSVRAFVKANISNAELKEIYNSCVEWVEKFRSKHLEYAVQYINKQQQKSALNPTAVGTGGTPFVEYLTKHRDETSDHLV